MQVLSPANSGRKSLLLDWMPLRRSASVNKDVNMVEFQTFSADSWNSVAPERRTPMQQHIWALAAAETLSPTERVLVVTIGPPERPTAIAPLTRSVGGPPRRRLLGAEELGESVEVVYRDAAALELLATSLVQTGLPLSFGHYLHDTPFIESLRRAYGRWGLVVSKSLPMRGSPYIKLDASWSEPEQNFTARRRSDLRRMQRNAEKLGTVTTEILQPTPQELGSLFEEAMAVEANGWKGRSGTALQVDRKLERFFRRYTQLACEAGILRLCFLRIDGKAVAMQLAVETDERFWLFKIGYDETYGRCSPGNLLMRETIRYAAQRGLKSYEFLGKEAPWTELWTQAAHPITALRTYPFNFAGFAALAADGITSIKRNFEERMERRSQRRKTSKESPPNA